MRIEPLDVPTSIEISGYDQHHTTIRKTALIQADTLFLSELAAIDDPEVVECLILSADLTPSEIWHIRDGMRVRLLEESVRSSGSDLPSLDVLEEEASDLPFDDYEEPPAPAEATPEPSPERSPRHQLEQKAARETSPPPLPIESYVIESDILGDGAVEAGHHSSEMTVKLRGPRKPRTGHAGSQARSRGTKEVEQRGLDIYLEHVLDALGVRVSDQRLRPRVGADLVCDDGVWRELKTSTGQAPDRLALSLHERARAAGARDRYELVVVENVFGDDPKISVILNPMENLNSEPTGDVIVTDWREKSSHFRVIQLGTSKNTD